MTGGRRNIDIGRDAADNVLITGDGNIVIINTIPPVLDEIEEAVERPLGPNPYRGLLAFQEEHAQLMFGRNRLIERLWQRFRDLHHDVQTESELRRVLSIIGPSGCGKSSLARAGLLPELAARPIRGIERAIVGVVTPGERPVEALAVALARITTNKAVETLDAARAFERELNRVDENDQYSGLRHIASCLPSIANSHVILLVDQFEDLYSVCKERSHRHTFVENLLLAGSDRDAHVSVILCLRSDFLAETRQNWAFNNVICENGIIVPVMTDDEVRDAIREPARLAGHPLDDNLVEMLLSQTKEREGALGLLEFALKSIWEGLQTDVAPAATLQRIGGVGGSLANEAQRIYDDLPPGDQLIARRCFVSLAKIGESSPWQLGEGTKVTRRRMTLGSLVAHCDDPNHVRAVLGCFATPSARLISLSADATGPVMAEVTHEAIFDRWLLLEQWIEGSRDDMRFRDRLNDDVGHWERQERPEGSLWRQPNLDDLREYHDRARDSMTTLQLEFFTASEEAEASAETARLKAILSFVITTLRHKLDADRATIFLYDKSKNKLFTTVAHGVSAGDEIRLSATEGLAGESFQAREIINVPEAYKDHRFNRRIDKKTGFRTKSILTIPLITPEGDIVGVAQVLNKRAGPFDAKDEQIASAFAEGAAAEIKRGQTNEQRRAGAQIETGLRSKSTSDQPHSQE